MVSLENSTGKDFCRIRVIESQDFLLRKEIFLC